MPIIDDIIRRAAMDRLLAAKTNSPIGVNAQEPAVGTIDPTYHPGRINYPGDYDVRNNSAINEEMFKSMPPLTTDGKIIDFGLKRAQMIADKIKNLRLVQDQLRKVSRQITTNIGTAKDRVSLITKGMDQIKQRLDPRIGTPEFENLSLKEKQLALGDSGFQDYTTYQEMQQALPEAQKQLDQHLGDWGKLADTWQSAVQKIREYEQTPK